MSSRLSTLLTVLALSLLAGCATPPARQSAVAPGPQPLTADNAVQPAPSEAGNANDAANNGAINLHPQEEATHEPPKPEIQKGTGRFINEQAARAPIAGGGPEGQVVFNFENQPVQAVVKAILGDLLHENYTIAPNVGGNVTFSTAKPIRPDQAMTVLETLLSWTGNTLVYQNGRYTVLQLKDAIPGKLAPRVAPASSARGYEVRVFPLKYVSPSEMAKLLKPYAKPEAIVSADTARSMIVMAGTASELENYQRTIETFDVDWLKGMSIGVFTLEHMEVAKLLPELEKVFGAQGESPLAGMFRFLPLEQVNALVVITPQQEYLKQAEEWLHRLDRGGGENGTQLYVYDVKNVKVVDLAQHLGDIFGASVSGGGGRTSTSGSVAPGLTPITIGSLGGAGGAGMNYNSAPRPTPAPRAVTPAATNTGNGKSDIRFSAVEENNQLLVMATPSEWDTIREAIRRLDVQPLQVQIEAKILEVSLSGELKFGVQWYLAGLIGTATGSAEANGNYGPSFTGNSHDRHRASLGALGNVSPSSAGGLFYSFLNKNFEVAINALETKGDARALAAPSLVVLNNQEAKINVGTQIPVVQTYVTGYSVPTTTGTGGTTGTGTIGTSGTGIGNVQYLNTGTILDVKPRVNPGGLVYMEIQQEVSNPGTPAAGSSNPPINQRQISTQIAVQSGETVLLGGLIQDNTQNADNNVPLLGRIPILGRLFGNTDRSHQRTELIVLITPRVIANSEDARIVTEEYQRQFQSLTPLREKNAKPAPPAATQPLPPDPKTQETPSDDK